MDEDAELLLAARRDPEAFAALYRRHARGIYAFLRRRVPSTELAFDLTAETFAAALESLDRFRPGEAPGRAWLYGIAWRKHSEALRRGRAEDRARRRLGMEPVTLTDEGIERIEREAAGQPVRDALAGLPDDQRTAIEARVVGEEDYAGIAAGLECSESVVRQRVSRGLRTLRARLEGGHR